jgi:hypothetical protein
MSLAMVDGSRVFALIRDNICASNQLDPAKIDHIVVILAHPDGPKMITAECTTRQTDTQWCADAEHKKEILRGMLSRLNELYP